jgi:5-methylcytosine-specific restriction endonuclease McrA
MLTKICIVCGKEYTKKVNCSVKNWKISKYCSHKCLNKSKIGKPAWNRRDDMETVCPNCGKQFRKRCQTDKYCCRKCARAKQIIPAESYRQSGIKRTGDNNPMKLEENKEKIRLANLGSKSHFWKGGLSKENYRFRRTVVYRKWRMAVYERDNYTCQKCGKRGGKLQAHHLKSFEKYPELRLDVSNGQTLCIACHIQTDSYAKNLS